MKLLGGSTADKYLEVIRIKGKSQDIANDGRNTNYKVGILIASNAGRPGGALGKIDGSGLSGNYNKYYKTQEESIIASWLQAEEYLWNKKQKKMGTKLLFQPNNLFRQYLGDLNKNGRPWGMIDADSTSVKTIQMIDFTIPFHTKDGKSKIEQAKNYAFAYSINNKPISNTLRKKYRYVNLVFVYGPNVSADGHRTGSTSRTKVRSYQHSKDYPVFKLSVKEALRAGLINMCQSKVDIAILAKVSGGIYAGKGSPTHKQINEDYDSIINEILSEEYPAGSGKNIGSYFKKVILPI